VAASARSDLATVADLLDSQYDGVYVFAGQDSSNPPVPNPDQITSSGFFTQIAAAVANLTTAGAPATAAATLAIASSTTAGTSPFSATYLAQPTAELTPPLVSTEAGQSQPLGLLANTNIGPVSTGTSTTGSYMLDLMRALATVGNLTSGQVNDPSFAPMVADTQTSVTGLISSMSNDVGILGEQQASLTALSTTLSDTSTAGCRHGGDIVEPDTDTNAIAGVVSTDRRRERHVTGKVSSSKLIQSMVIFTLN
jgi:flagellar hook-associated protein 3 FlgL